MDMHLIGIHNLYQASKLFYRASDMLVYDPPALPVEGDTGLLKTGRSEMKLNCVKIVMKDLINKHKIM